MKNIILLFTFSLFFTSCESNETTVLKNDYDIQPFLTELEALGYDISNDSLLFEIGYENICFGENERGNALAEYALSKRDHVNAENYRHWSVQNTKNGNYAIAIDLLEKSMLMDAEEVSAYYGWVLLYYYRDYEKALKVLEQCDAYTPNFSDAPMGEDIHYLKGLCQMQLLDYQKAIEEFDIYINETTAALGENWVDVYTFVHKGRCLIQMEKFDEAINSFNKAIKHYENCTEAYYFKGLTQIETNQTDAACTNFNIAYDLIKSGYKNSDVYVEYFHEIYPQQVEMSIAENCSK